VLLLVSRGLGGGLTFSGGCAYLQRSWYARDPLVALRVAHCDCKTCESSLLMKAWCDMNRPDGSVAANRLHDEFGLTYAGIV
jgi:hypothetical protein